MTLDEAIAKAKADGDVQLAEWLRQARGAYAAARWYTKKLREERDMYRDLVGCMVHPDVPDQLAAENAKLRELCKDMYEDIVYGCAECFFPKYSEHSGKPSECDNGGCGYRQIADRIRDLGVEI